MAHLVAMRVTHERLEFLTGRCELRRCFIGLRPTSGGSMGLCPPSVLPHAMYHMRTSQRGSPSFVSPHNPPGKEEWEEETIRGDWSIVYVRLILTIYLSI